ncbi:hypothetical protein IET16_002297 [Enterococcus hirae]|nr:hypothetical protein [Enterococcus hirae]
MSKYQTTIKLMKKNEDGKYKQVQFKSAEFLPGPVVEEAAEVMEGMQNAVDKKSVSEALSRAYSFIADTLFEGQFTGEDYRQGIDAREIAPLTGKLLKSVTAGFMKLIRRRKKSKRSSQISFF